MQQLRHSRIRRAIAIAGGVIAVSGLLSVPAVHTIGAASAPAWQRPVDEQEYALLALANMARSDPALAGYPSMPVARPMTWSDNLGDAARYHSWDMVVNNCYGHDSCNGENWATRVGRFYPNWYALAENVGGGGAALLDHNAWMGSPGHRGNIMNGTYRDFGGGAWHDPVSTWRKATENFGASTNSPPIPPIPAATVLLPRFWEGTQNGPTWTWELLVNFYDANGKTPTSVKAYVDGVPQTLARVAGTNTNGTWGGYASAPGYKQNPFSLPDPYCKRVYFELTRSDGQKFRYPATEDVGLGTTVECRYRTPSGGGGTGSTTTTTTTVGPPPEGAPTVVIDSPADGARVVGTTEIRAHAVDDTKVKTIEVYVDGRRLVRRATDVVVRNWMAGARSVSPGEHTITVKAYDDAGNVGTKSITVVK